MPSSVAHGLAAVAVSHAFFPQARPRRLVAAAAIGAVLLDIDAVGRPFGLGDLAFLGGHRALAHGIPFAVALSAGLVIAFYRDRAYERFRVRLWICLSIAFATHGILDMFTTYGSGVMIFAPLSDVRIKAPWLPFRRVVPEIIVIWAPVLLFLFIRRRTKGQALTVRPNEELKPTAAPSSLVE